MAYIRKEISLVFLDFQVKFHSSTLIDIDMF